MVITYHGSNCFRVTSGAFSLVIDPTSERMKPDLTLKTLVNPSELSSDPRLIDAPGEFDVSDVHGRGVEIVSESTDLFIKTVFVIAGLEDLRLAFLGHISETPSREVIDVLGEVDILFLPLGGKPYLSSDAAVKTVKLIEPKIIIPALHGSRSDLSSFASEFGDPPAPADKLVLKNKDLPDKGLKVILLKNE